MKEYFVSPWPLLREGERMGVVKRYRFNNSGVARPFCGCESCPISRLHHVYFRVFYNSDLNLARLKGFGLC